MDKKKGLLSLFGILIAIVAGGYVCIFGVDENKAGSAAAIKQGLDLAGGVSITYQVAGEEEPSPEDMADTVYKLQKRVEVYSTEALVYQEGNNRINIEIPGVSDANTILEELGKPGSLVFVDSEGNVVIDGTQIKEAQPATQQDSMGNSEFVVALTMTEEGSKKFAEATRKAAPTQDIIYIIYDDEIVSAPSVQSEITDGQCVIQGMASYEEAESLSSVIRIGGLKLELEELCSKVVGAQLGTQAISTSLKAGAIGMVLVMIFMIVVYAIPGLASAIALVVYLVLTILLLNGFEITLTLPGIAGIILSIGMAVDANVIIFSRIREELATGKTVRSSIKIGFQKALSAILDGNVTTLIAALVLWFLGTGTVKGFAQTLALGIALSMFTALVVTRIILNAFFAIGIKDIKFYGIAKPVKKIDFLSKKALYFGVSIALIVVGFVSMGINKMSTGDILNYSLDFKGGTATNIVFNEDLSIEEIDTLVVPLIEEVTGGGGVIPQKVQGTNEVIIKTRTLELEEREKVNLVLEEEFGVDVSKITAETISSTISGEMKSDAIVAILVSTVCMLIYVWFRFKDIRFGASSVICLLHDVLIVIAFYSVAKVSVSSTFIACVLTIVGYSINATIVIFDRVRENMAEMKRKDDLKDVVNLSINQSLSRSIFTSLTTFIMVAVLYVLGVTSIREFALPLMVGIVCGAFSSVCIAGALWYILRCKFEVKESDE
ncbi:MAG: protein translocase subunit SecD [Lachnospiraceae bacterium]|nr:protein translocase subunit SecD [Lachnospiraceae bacterium]